MMRDELEEAVSKFVAEERGVPVAAVSLRTTLLGDLGVDGNDADKILAAFASRFSVDLSGLPMERHFGPEGLPPWFLLTWFRLALTPGTPEEKAGLESISVGDLVEAARARTWAAVANKPIQRPGMKPPAADGQRSASGEESHCDIGR